MMQSTLHTFLLCWIGYAWGTSYSLTKDYSGQTFFDDWIFYNNFDNTTNGLVDYLGSTAAFQQKLAFINDAGNAVMKVDNSTVLTDPNSIRNSIRIASTDFYTVGSLWTADMVHVPFGCSVWPAWWSQAQVWPEGGEIDTFESANMFTQNHISLHTEPGCLLINPNQTSTIINSTDCSYLANNQSGCSVFDPNTDSFGEPFAAAGGGLFVTEFAETGISVWFFTRSMIPSSLQNNSSTIDTSLLGIPVANFPATNCSINEFFTPQQLTFDITLCGDYAGMESVFSQTCSGSCQNDWVLGPPSNYDNAYFEVKSVRVFSNGTNTTIPGASLPPSSAAPTVSGGLGTNGEGSSSAFGGTSRSINPPYVSSVFFGLTFLIVTMWTILP